MAKARRIAGITPHVTFREAAANAVEVRTRELFSFAGGILDIGDFERVHDMRVASRRLRAVLEVFSPCFPRRELKAVLREVKGLADDLGERRDPDVAIETLAEVRDGLARDDRPGIDHLIDALTARQAAANDRLARRIEEVETSDLEARLLGLAASARVEAVVRA